MKSLEEFKQKFITNEAKKITDKPKIRKSDMSHFKHGFERGQSYMMDLIFLPDDNGYKYALVVLDLATNNIDAEPVQNRQASTMVNALKNIFKRKFIKPPKAMVTTDAGNEFKDKFDKYCKDNGIFHRTTKVGRHQQLLPIDNKIALISKYLNIAMVSDELTTNKTSRKWTPRLTQLIKILNQPKYLYKVKTDDEIQDMNVEIKGNPDLYEVGTKVRVICDSPTDHLSGKRLHGRFRVGDVRFSKRIHTIKFVVLLPQQPAMYIVDGMPHVYYTRNDLQVV